MCETSRASGCQTANTTRLVLDPVGRDEGVDGEGPQGTEMIFLLSERLPPISDLRKNRNCSTSSQQSCHVRGCYDSQARIVAQTADNTKLKRWFLADTHIYSSRQKLFDNQSFF